MPAKQSIRTELAGIVAVLAFAVAAGILAFVMSTNNYFPAKFLPVINAIIVLVTGYAWVLILTAVIEKVVAPTIGRTRAAGIKNLLYVVAAIIIVVIVSAIFQFNLTGVLVGAGFAGIVLGLAAQQVLGNIFGGLSLLASRPFEIGDRITLVTASFGLLGPSYNHEALLNGFTGVVTDITIFFTRMDLDDGTPAVFPNLVVVGSMAVNHSKVPDHSVRVRMDLDKKIGYENFKQRFLESLRNQENIDAARSSVEIVDIGSTTYQVVMIIWTKYVFNDPVRTLAIQNAMQIQADLASQLSSSAH